MNGLNQIIIEGKVSSDTNFEIIQNGLVRASVKIEVQRQYKDWKEISQFDIVGYGNLAEILKEFAHKDRGIRVIGRLKSESEKVVIVAEHIEFKPGK
jgi:single-strand DNA-binding protein